MDIDLYKTVLMPIQVSNSDHCCGEGTICGYFDSEGGHPTCDLNLDDGDLRYDRKNGDVRKPDKCKNLKGL